MRMPTQTTMPPPSICLLVVILLALPLAACNPTGNDDGGGAAVTLTADDAGSTFEVEQGETIVIELASNPTTGYEWAVDELDPAVLTYTGSAYEPDESDAVGQGGTQRLSFQAANPGRSVIDLKYWRSWEGDSSIAERYTVTLGVVAGS